MFNWWLSEFLRLHWVIITKSILFYGLLTLLNIYDINKAMGNNQVKMNTKTNCRFDAGLISPVSTKALVFSHGMFVTS